MPKYDRTSRRSRILRAHTTRFCLYAAAVVCLGGVISSVCFSPKPLRAVADATQESATSIRLGLPTFAFEPNATSLAPRHGGTTGHSALIQITPGVDHSGEDIIITPQGSTARAAISRPAALGTAQTPASFHQASQQTDAPPEANDEAAEARRFWKSVVNGEATRLELQAPSDGVVQPPIGQSMDTGSPSFRPQQQNGNPGAVPAVPNSNAGAPIPLLEESPRVILAPAEINQMRPPALGGHSRFDGSEPAEVSSPGDSSSLPLSPLGAHSISSIQSPSPLVTSGHSFHQTQPGMSGYRATGEQDAADWMSPYAMRADHAVEDQPADIVPILEDMPSRFRPWWDAIVRQPLNPRAATMQVNVSNLIQDALLYSPQVVAIQTEPEVKYRIVTQEAARFDWTAFLESTYNDLNEPVGNELTTGTAEDRLLTRKWQFSSGVRRKNLVGGELQVTQDFGHENQNSRFFLPNNQASSRLELSYRQPLLDGAGRSYNQSEIVLARIEANSSEDEVVDALQDHLIQVTTAYWTLYRARAEFFQRQKLLISSQDVMNRLQGRAEVDTIPRQILRARAAVARAKTGIRRTLARVKDAEAQLRLLVNSPGMLNGGPTELLPSEYPEHTTESADLQSVLQIALFNRADISGAIRQMRAAGVRLGVSQQEMLPRLDLLVSGYVADLAGSSDLGTAIRGKYLDNRPGYTVGMEFELPLGNRAARARNEQRQWELKRAINVFRATVEKSLTDVEIGRREVETAYAEMNSRFQSMDAANQESEYLKDRFDVLPGSEDSATLLLEDLLDSFERLADEESAFVRAQVDHALSLINLKRQMGTLLRSRHDRPTIDSAQQQWVQDRQQTHAPALENQDEVDNAASSSPSPIVESPSPQSNEKKQIAREASGVTAAAGRSSQDSSKIQRMSHQRYNGLYVPRGEPIPTHQTTWKRSPLNQ